MMNQHIILETRNLTKEFKGWWCIKVRTGALMPDMSLDLALRPEFGRA